MTEPTTANTDKVVTLDSIFESAKESSKKQPPSRKRVVPTVTKEALRSVFEFLSFSFVLSGKPQFALSSDEIDQLSEAWYAVLKEYPGVGKYLIVGNKVTVWGNALLVTYIVVSKRTNFVANLAGAARDPNRDDGQRQNDARPAVA